MQPTQHRVQVCRKLMQKFMPKFMQKLCSSFTFTQRARADAIILRKLIDLCTGSAEIVPCAWASDSRKGLKFGIVRNPKVTESLSQLKTCISYLASVHSCGQDDSIGAQKKCAAVTGSMWRINLQDYVIYTSRELRVLPFAACRKSLWPQLSAKLRKKIRRSLL